MADDAYPMPGYTTMKTLPEWEAYFTALSGSGVINGLAPSLDTSGRAAIAGPGSALLRGIYKPVTAATATPVPAPASQPRVDRLVLRLNRAAVEPADFVTFSVVTGTPAARPSPPAIRQEITAQGVWDLPISRWTSHPTGALTGLVDERAVLGTVPILYSSHAPPSPMQPTLGVETDTGRVTFWNGNAWRPITDDTGWVNLPINGPDAGAWSANNLCRVRKRNGIVHLRFAVRRWDKDELPVWDDGSSPLVLPPEFRPPWDEPGFAWHTRSPVTVMVQAAGPVRLWALTSPIPAGRTVFGSATYMAAD